MSAFNIKPIALAVFASLAWPAWSAGIPTLQEVSVSSNVHALIGVADAATEGTVTEKQLALRPLLRPAEVMEAVPGMIVTQHSGDGKANQYFLRGFNLDHGSDFSTHVLGMPANMNTHAHGQGYMDLNWLMPELIAGVRYRKGVYAAEDGDFAVAGSARIDYKRSLERNFLDLGLGQHGYRRALFAGSTRVAELNLLGAIEASGNNGPWDQPEKLDKLNALLRVSEGTADNGFSLTGMAYRADWTASEQVPERAIASGQVSRFGALSPNDGGRTHRYSLSGDWARTDAEGSRRANLYVIDYGLNLYSAPSGYIDGTAQPAQHEQADRRRVWGGEGSRSWFLGPDWRDTEITARAQWRQDRISGVGLYRTLDRRRLDTVRADRVDQMALGLALDARTQWLPWLRTQVGLRHDRNRAEVASLAGVFNADNGGTAQASQTSPKLGLVIGPFDLLGPTEFYANWGQGFHTNDARGATARTNPQDGSAAQAIPLIVKARGSEFGLRTAPLKGWNSSLSVWQMKLDSELVYVGDEGVSEPKGGSRRYGVEWSNYVTPFEGWILDADLAWSRARFIEPNSANGGSKVPNAIPLTASLGLGVDKGGPWSGGLRLRYLGAYALEETGSQRSQAFLMASLKVAYRYSRDLQFTLDVLNLFDRKANDIEYWGGACTRSEALSGACGGGIDGRLIHPLEPRNFRVGMRLSF